MRSGFGSVSCGGPVFPVGLRAAPAAGLPDRSGAPLFGWCLAELRPARAPGGGLGRTSGCRQRFCAARLGCGRDGGCRSSAAFLPGFCWCLVVFLPDAYRASAGPFERKLPGICRISAGFLPGFGYCRSDSGRRPLRRIVGAAPAMPAVRRRLHAADGTRPERLRVCLPPAPDAREHPARGGIGAPPSNRRRPDRRRRTARHFPCLRDGGRRPRPAERGPERASPCRRWLRPDRIGGAADRRGGRAGMGPAFSPGRAQPRFRPGIAGAGRRLRKSGLFEVRSADLCGVRCALRIFFLSLRAIVRNAKTER